MEPDWQPKTPAQELEAWRQLERKLTRRGGRAGSFTKSRRRHLEKLALVRHRINQLEEATGG